MDSLTLSTISKADSVSAIQFFPQRILYVRKSRILNFPSRKFRKHLVFASKDEPQFDEWDKMELKFGRMIGEDPKLTLAKIMGRKYNPDMSYLEIEKLFNKKKGRASIGDIEEIPFDISVKKKPTRDMKEIPFDMTVEKKSAESTSGLNLVRPVLKKGFKFEATDKPVGRDAESKSFTQPIIDDRTQKKSSVPDVILRKPSLYHEDDDEKAKLSMFNIKPNLSLKMGRTTQKERFSDITLLKKPEPITSGSELGEESDSTDGKARFANEIKDNSLVDGSNDIPILQKPEPRKLNLNEWDQDSTEEQSEVEPRDLITENNVEFSNLDDKFPETKQKESVFDEGTAAEFQGDMLSGREALTSDVLAGNNPAISVDSVLKGKPTRLDPSGKTKNQKIPESLGNPSELDNLLTAFPVKEGEDGHWDRAEELVKTREREEVELISASTRGFVVLFGSVIGFLPYRNLAARWKFLAFESWLRRKGLDPSNYRQNLGIIGKYEGSSIMDYSESVVDSDINSKKSLEAITSDMKLEDLLMIYDQEKLKFLSSFVGQRIRVGVVLADRNSRKLIVSVKPKEKEEMVEKKRSLMARLTIGDIVKCCINKITYFGVFVEVDGVPALIHQSEVSWDATLDPASYFKVGQIVDAKVHQLDFSMERIFLSLKEITPDPLMEALEAVVGDNGMLDGRLEAAEADSEWADVESIIKELEHFDGIQSVSKGRYFLSPGLAPTFQVYMASMFENQYKLLARAGNRVQEIIVQTSLSKEELKSVILTCTNRVE